MLKQNSAGLLDDIKAIGCFFKSCIAVAELQTGISLTAEQHNEMWRECGLLKYIIEENIKNSAPIIQMAFRYLGKSVSVVEVGTDKDGYYKWIQNNPKYQRIDARIEKILQGGPSKTHFRVVSDGNEVLFEPHNPEIRSLGHVHTIWYFIEG